jgi:hypothetical protein
VPDNFLLEDDLQLIQLSDDPEQVAHFELQGKQTKSAVS